MRRRGWGLVLAVVTVGVLFVGVFPTRTWLAQRKDLKATATQVKVLSDQNAELEDRVKGLNTDDEIERLARRDYGLVRPGEEAYAVLPAPPGPKVTGSEPAEKEHQPGFWSRVLDDVTFWS